MTGSKESNMFNLLSSNTKSQGGMRKAFNPYCFATLSSCYIFTIQYITSSLRQWISLASFLFLGRLVAMFIHHSKITSKQILKSSFEAWLNVSNMKQRSSYLFIGILSYGYIISQQWV